MIIIIYIHGSNAPAAKTDKQGHKEKIMAQYQITHSCGHTKTHQIFGTNSKGQRDNKRAWLATTLCEDCYKAEQNAKHAAENAAAAKANKAAALPELTGTPKQIAWAESIRAAKIAELDGIMKPDAANGEYPEIYAQCMDIINAVKNQTSASYWIDNRTKVFNGRWLQNQHQTKYGN